jgi:hypothetical protein
MDQSHPDSIKLNMKIKGVGPFLDYIDCNLSPKGNWILLTPANELFVVGILKNECDEG